MSIRFPFFLLLAAVTGCDGASHGALQPGEVVRATGEVACSAMARADLPGTVNETSGLMLSASRPGLFWTHNDSGNTPEIYGLDSEGELVQRVRVRDAENQDWEDMTAGPCGEGDCLYIGDIGDNGADRERITVYRFSEPPAGAMESEPAQALHARYPDGPRDAEGLFMLPPDQLFILSKGREDDVTLYRFPLPLGAGGTVTLETVARLFPQPDGRNGLFTAAAASPDGRWVGVRSYDRLYFFRSSSLLSGSPGDPSILDLLPLGQPQGESLAIGEDGEVWLSSEGGIWQTPVWARLRCVFPD